MLRRGNPVCERGFTCATRRVASEARQSTPRLFAARDDTVLVRGMTN